MATAAVKVGAGRSCVAELVAGVAASVAAVATGTGGAAGTTTGGGCAGMVPAWVGVAVVAVGVVGVVATLATLAICGAYRSLPRTFGGGDGDAPAAAAGERRRTLLLVIAHPDDESMFFVPALRAFAAAGWRLAVLCCTNGHGGGDAAVRSRELVAAGRVLGMEADDITILSHPALPDSMSAAWDPLVVRGVVATEAVKRGADAVLTFDDRGVSGHINHRSAHAGVALYATQGTAVPCYSLDTVPLLRKFSAAADIALSAVLHLARGGASTAAAWPHRLLLVAPTPTASYAAMSAHASQYVWFRRLFVAFSRYTWVNTLTALPRQATDAAPAAVAAPPDSTGAGGSARRRHAAPAAAPSR